MSENPFAGQGAVMLDIGGDVGALVVSMPSSMIGAEIEIDAVGGARPERNHGHDHEQGHGHEHRHGHAHRAHVAVVDRPSAEGSQPSLVFPELVEGSYELFDKGADDVHLTAEITGGQVTFLEWPDA